MNVDLNILAQWAGAIVAIWGAFKLIVEPFKSAIKRNDETMKSLQKSIDVLSFELQSSQSDRQRIHKVLDRHEVRLGEVEDHTIRNTERINTLFNK